MDQVHGRTVENHQVHRPTHRAGQIVGQVQVKADEGAGRVPGEQTATSTSLSLTASPRA